MAEQRFGADLRVYGKAFIEDQGLGDKAVVARALLHDQIVLAEDRANHTGTQLFATISDGATYVDGRVQAVVGAAPAALDTLQEIAAQLEADETAAAAITNMVTDLRTDVDAHTGRLNTDDTLLAGLRTDLNADTGLITGLRTDLTTTQGNVATNTSGISSLRADLTVAQSNITALRSDVDALSGGTGASTSQLRSDLDALTLRVTAAEAAIAAATAAGAAYKVTIGDGVTSLLQVTHNLNTTDVDVVVRDLTDGQQTYPVDAVTGVNTISLDFGTYKPAANTIRVIVRAL
jgi:chromosome segregation ATPase